MNNTIKFPLSALEKLCAEIDDEPKKCKQSELLELLQECDFWLAHLEDFTKGPQGDEVTALRARIEKAI
jgi:hypothetical protein